MGQTLSSPDIDKHSARGEDSQLAYGVSEMQGWRLSMEDAHATILSLDDPQASHDVPDESVSDKPPKTDINRAFFAVYDGHGGHAVAKYAGNMLHDRIKSCPTFLVKDYPQALKDTFMSVDVDLRSLSNYTNDPSGCTAVVALIGEDRTIHVANAGDSRAIMSVGGTAVPLSYDHKPTNESEKQRIVAAGGFVDFGRVNGNLALSRALGDFEYKRNTNISPEQQAVTAMPEVETHVSTPEDEFLILACDGIWDVLTSQQVVDFVRRKIAQERDLDVICEDLMDFCLAPNPEYGGIGCDNMTVLVVALLNGRTKKEWYEWVASRVEQGIGHQTPVSVVSPYRESSYRDTRDMGDNSTEGSSNSMHIGGEDPSESGGIVIDRNLAEVLSNAGMLLTQGGIVQHTDKADEEDDVHQSPKVSNIQDVEDNMDENDMELDGIDTPKRGDEDKAKEEKNEEHSDSVPLKEESPSSQEAADSSNNKSQTTSDNNVNATSTSLSK